MESRRRGSIVFLSGRRERHFRRGSLGKNIFVRKVYLKYIFNFFSHAILTIKYICCIIETREEQKSMPTLNLKTKGLLRDEVREKIVRMITDNGISKGERLLPEKEIGRLLNVNHVTVRAACSELVEKNILVKIPGHGTYFNGFEQSTIPAGTRVAGILMQEEDHLYNIVRNQIVADLQEQGYLCRMTSLDSHYRGSFLPSVMEMARNGVETLIVMQPELEKFPDIIEFLEKNRSTFKKIVRVFGNGSRPRHYPGCQVMIDVEATFRMRVERLKQAGCRRIAYLGMCCDRDYILGPQNQQFRDLYVNAMIEAGLAPYIMARNTSDNPEGIQALLTGPERPEAIITATDHLSVRILESARLRGIRVPEDLCLIGSYNTPWAELFHISSFCFDIPEFAGKVAQAVQEGTDEGTFIIPVRLVERDSVRKSNPADEVKK